MTGVAVDVTPAGHDLEHWARARAAAEHLDLATLTDRLGIAAGATLLVLAAHPDDETLGLGRLMHRWSRHVGPVAALVGSAGEACLDHVGPRPEGLAERRLAEWYAATAILEVSRQHALALPDGRLTDCEPALAAALDVVAGELLASHLSAPAGQLVLACPWRQDPHPDHRSVGRVTGAVGRRRQLPVLEFGVWMTYWSEPADLVSDDRRLAVLTTDQADESAHQRACAEFATQLEPLVPGFGAVVPPAMLAHHHEQLLVLPSGITRSPQAPEKRSGR